MLTIKTYCRKLVLVGKEHSRISATLCLVSLCLATYAALQWQEHRNRHTCAMNLKHMGLVFKLYAIESTDNYWPTLNVEPGKFSFAKEVINPNFNPDSMPELIAKYFPDFSPSPQLLHCSLEQKTRTENAESIVSEVNDQSYWYLGARVWDQQSGQNYIQAYKVRAESKGEKDFLSGRGSSDFIAKVDINNVYKLKEGICRHCWEVDDEDTKIFGSQIPVMIERPGNHHDGANVLYMDGHVEFIPYPGKFPMTEKFITALQNLDKLGQTTASEQMN